MSKYPEYSHEKSRAWFDRALNVIPSGVYGHLGPSEGLFLPLETWPLISSKAEGTSFWDMDGNRYLDFMCAYGPNVLGYGDPDVDKAAMEQLKVGNCTTAPSFKMVECAELLVDIQSDVIDEFNESRMGKTIEVICENFDRLAECWYGRSYADSPEVDGKIFFTGKGLQPGEFINVLITDTIDGDLMGEAVL